MIAHLIDLAYLAAALLFILGIKRLSHPSTAARGNRMAAAGMLLAVVVTLGDQQILSPVWILIGLGVGGVVGGWLALRVETTAMPQLVGFFNGMGGAASALVAWSYLEHARDAGAALRFDELVAVALSIFVGNVTLTGSLVATGKLLESGWARRLLGGSVRFPLQKTLNTALGLLCVALMVQLCLDPTAEPPLYALLGVSSALGVLLVLPIGGADMPVVIALLNSFSGLAASLTGFVLANKVLIIAGSLVGASGLILTDIMCKGMNRTLFHVLFSAFAGTGGAGGAAQRRSKDEVPHRSAEDAAIVLENARSVIITPGYGLAVAQAQHVVRELADMLARNGSNVRFAIHPVAGRMPGHMNVLLAEADLSYDRLYAMEEINEAFEHTDVCLVIGANDVTNPCARTDVDGPLYGMPILNCDQARTVMVIKRSLSPGYAGVDNPLFYLDKTMMLFGDGKAVVQGIIDVLKG